MTIKFIYKKPKTPCIGDNVELCVGKTTTVRQLSYIGRSGKITRIDKYDDSTKSYTVNIDGGLHFWFLDELKLIK